MRRIILLTVILYSFNTNAQTDTAFAKLQWLVGEWTLTNPKPGHSGLEKWIANSPTELQGWGITMKGKDTAFVEKTKLLVVSNLIYYVADVPGNKEPVYFKLTSITDDEFICENAAHDFPKKIKYKKVGSGLKATISGDEKSIDYFFDRKL